MAGCEFVLDIIVTQFESSLVKVEDFKDLRIEVTFNNKVIAIRSSRFNMTEFQSGSSTNFSGTAAQLRQILEKCGLPIVVNYSGGILGTAHITIPSNIIDAISDEGMDDLLHVEMCKIERQGLIVGTMEVFAQLVLKDQLRTTLGDCSRNKDRSLCPKDILFLMADCQRISNQCSPCHPCLDGDLLDDHFDDLKIRGYSSSDAKDAKLKQIFTYDPVATSILSQIKSIGTDYERAIDSIRRATGQLKSPCRTAEPLGTPCEKPWSTPTRKMSTSQRKPPNELTACRCTQPFMRPRRFCPVCLLNLTWIPKFANCPRCGVKPMPTVEQRRPIKKEDDLLMPSHAFGDICRHLSAGSKEVKKKVKRCRCKCVHGKLCAYCRVRKQIPDIILPPANQFSSSEEDDEQSEDICVTKKNSEFRPFLSQMFSELCILHNINVTKPENCTTVVPKPQPAKGHSVVEGTILPKGKPLNPLSSKQPRKPKI